MSSVPQKSALRSQMLAARESFSGHERKMADAAIFHHLCGWFKQHRIRGAVGVYYPFRSECDTLSALHFLHQEGVRVALPCLTDQTLLFRHWQPGAEMHLNRFGIPEPAMSELLQPAIALIPLVAFDKRGTRLGYGGGFYDRTLERLRGNQTLKAAIGIAYGFQETDALPYEPHDALLDAVITENGFHAFPVKPL